MLSKTEKVRRYWTRHPDADPTAVMEKFDASSATVYTTRRAVKNNSLPPRARKVEDKDPVLTIFSDIKTIQEIGVERVRKILDLLS